MQSKKLTGAGVSVSFPAGDRPGEMGGVTTVKKTLVVTLNATTTVTGEGCAVSNPGMVYGQVFATPPNGAETQILSVTAGDVVPSGSCMGVHTKSVSATPLSAATGIYKIRFHGYHANVVGYGASITETPSILIVADGNPVVKSPYPILAGEGSVDDAWEFAFEP